MKPLLIDGETIAITGRSLDVWHPVGIARLAELVAHGDLIEERGVLVRHRAILFAEAYRVGGPVVIHAAAEARALFTARGFVLSDAPTLDDAHRMMPGAIVLCTGRAAKGLHPDARRRAVPVTALGLDGAAVAGVARLAMR